MGAVIIKSRERQNFVTDVPVLRCQGSFFLNFFFYFFNGEYKHDEFFVKSPLQKIFKRINIKKRKKKTEMQQMRTIKNPKINFNRCF